MLNIKTKSGLSVKVDVDKLKDDWEWVECASAIQRDNTKYPEFIKLTLGDAQYEKLKKHNRKDGHVSTEGVNKDFKEIMKQIQALEKN